MSFIIADDFSRLNDDQGVMVVNETTHLACRLFVQKLVAAHDYSASLIAAKLTWSMHDSVAVADSPGWSKLSTSNQSALLLLLLTNSSPLSP